MAVGEVELLKVMLTFVATVGSISAIIYTWVWCKTAPKTWTLTGMVALLWGFALTLWGQRLVLYYVDAITTPEVANMRSFFLIIAVIGYTFFLYGTWNSGPVNGNRVLLWRREKKAG